LQYIGYVTVHYHRIETDLRKISRLWTAYPGTGPGNSTSGTATFSAEETVAVGAGKRPVAGLIARFLASSLTAAAASLACAFGIRQGYVMKKLAIPKMYWQRPGKIVVV